MRVRPTLLLFFDCGDCNSGIVSNISEDGMAVAAAQPLCEETSITISIRSPDSGELTELKGQIAWKSRSWKRAGVKFAGLSREELQRIQSWMALEPPAGEFPSEEGSLNGEPAIVLPGMAGLDLSQGSFAEQSRQEGLPPSGEFPCEETAALADAPETALPGISGLNLSQGSSEEQPGREALPPSVFEERSDPTEPSSEWITREDPADQGLQQADETLRIPEELVEIPTPVASPLERAYHFLNSAAAGSASIKEAIALSVGRYQSIPETALRHRVRTMFVTSLAVIASCLLAWELTHPKGGVRNVAPAEITQDTQAWGGILAAKRATSHPRALVPNQADTTVVKEGQRPGSVVSPIAQENRETRDRSAESSPQPLLVAPPPLAGTTAKATTRSGEGPLIPMGKTRVEATFPKKETPKIAPRVKETPTKETQARETKAMETPVKGTHASETRAKAPTKETHASETRVKETQAKEIPARETMQHLPGAMAAANNRPLGKSTQTLGAAPPPTPPQIDAKNVLPANPLTLSSSHGGPAAPKGKEEPLAPMTQPAALPSPQGSVSILVDPYPSLRVPEGLRVKKQRQGTNLQFGHLLSRVEPVYPEEAKQQRIEGTVVLHAVIGRNGSVENLQSVNGPPILVAAAMSAVRKWHYTETSVAGKPAETEEDIAVTFRLSNPPPLKR